MKFRVPGFPQYGKHKKITESEKKTEFTGFLEKRDFRTLKNTDFRKLGTFM